MLTLLDYLVLASSFASIYITLVYFFIYFENKNKVHRYPRLPKKLPKVSIIVPAYNEEENLERCVNSLINLDYPKNLLEILIVNDGSTDNTPKIANRLARKYKIVRAFHKENGGKGSALNYGLKRAKGEIVVVMDADSYVEKDALKKTIGYFKDPKMGAVATAIKVANPSNTLQELQWYEYLFNIFYRKVQAFINGILVIPGPFSLYRKSALEEVGGFDENNLTEDFEITLKLRKFGYKIEASSVVSTYTEAPKSLIGLIRQRIRWYRGHIFNILKHKDVVFTTKHKDFSLFVEPANLAMVAISILIFFYSLYVFGFNLFKQIYSFFAARYIPIDISISKISEEIAISPLFIGLSSISLFFIYTFFFFLIYVGVKVSMETLKEKVKVTKDVILLGVVYSYILVITWIVSIIKEIKRERAKWYK